MYKFLDNLLLSFKKQFSRVQTFNWFVIIVLGFIIRTDLLGLTSIVRIFSLDDLAYSCIKNFFRSDGFDSKNLLDKWCSQLAKKAPVFKIGGKAILVGDGIKRSTEGKFMPCSKWLKQDSSNNGKREYFIGHFYGCVSVLASACSTVLGIPIFFSLQDGKRVLSDWEGISYINHIKQILYDGIKAATRFGPSYLVLDRFFLGRDLIKSLMSSDYRELLDLIVRAKNNIVAYLDPPPDRPGKRGRKPKRGKAVKLVDYFNSPELFTAKEMTLYNKKKTVNFYAVNLIWGIGLYERLKFVLASYDNHQIILVTTDLKAKPEDIIKAYSYRFKIELTFKDFKHIFGGLFNHFWTKAVPKITRKGQNIDQELAKITNPRKQQKILKAANAIDNFVACCVIAMGSIQLLCLRFTDLDKSNLVYQRTRRRKIFSERQMKDYLQVNLFAFGYQNPDLAISKIIHSVKVKYS